MWRQRIKNVVPWTIHAVRAARWIAFHTRHPVAAATLDLRTAGKIVAGPFEGVYYPGSGIGRCAYPQRLGTYEHQLVPIVESVIARRPKLLVNVGAAYGYYALGFAKRCPNSKVIAYEADDTRAAVISKYARKSRIPNARLEVRGECTLASLQGDLTGSPEPFVMMDVEGAEDFLLDPSRVPGLRAAEILVELHDMFVPGVTERLRARFESTHTVTMISNNSDCELAAVWPRLRTLSISEPILLRHAKEKRGIEMFWMHLRPR